MATIKLSPSFARRLCIKGSTFDTGKKDLMSALSSASESDIHKLLGGADQVQPFIVVRINGDVLEPPVRLGEVHLSQNDTVSIVEMIVGG